MRNTRARTAGKVAMLLALVQGVGLVYSGEPSISMVGEAYNQDGAFDRWHNFQLSGSTGRNYLAWTDPSGHAGPKYTDFTLYNNSSSQSVCYTLSSEGPDNADTRMWTQTSSSNWSPVSDDRETWAYGSFTGLWIAPLTGVTIRVSAYALYANDINFQLRAYRLNGIASLSSCRGQLASNVPMVVQTGGWPTVLNGN